MKFMYTAAGLAAAVSAVSVETGSQLSAERSFGTRIGANSEAKPVTVTCDFNKVRSGVQKRARGPFRVQGHQFQDSAGDMTKDNVIWIDFEGLARQPENTLKAKIFEGVMNWKCEWDPMPDPPLWQGEETKNSDTDNRRVSMKADIPATADFALQKIPNLEDNYILFVENKIGVDTWETMGCCPLQLSTIEKLVTVYNEKFSEAGLSWSEEIKEMIEEEFKNNPDLEPGVNLPDSPDRATADVEWDEAQTCETMMADPAPADGTYTTITMANTISEFSNKFTIPRHVTVKTYEDDGNNNDECAGWEFETPQSAFDNLYDNTQAGAFAITVEDTESVGVGKYINSLKCSQDSSSPGHLACQMSFMDQGTDSPNTEDCGNYDDGSATDLTDESGRTTMTTMEVMLDTTTGYLVGVKYCEIPVNSGISWSQYLEWFFQAQSEWTDDTAFAYAESSGTGTYTKGPYFTEMAAENTENRSVPLFGKVTTYENGLGLCVGWDIIYWNYPGKTFEFQEDTTGTTTEEKKLAASADNKLSLLQVGTDDTDSDCLVVRWTFASGNIDCGTPGSDITDFPAAGAQYTPSYSGPPTYHSFEVAFHATKGCITKLKVWGQEPDMSGAEFQLWWDYNTENRPTDDATP